MSAPARCVELRMTEPHVHEVYAIKYAAMPDRQPWMNFIGIDPEFVAADGIAISPEQREASIAQALGETVRLAA